MKRGKEEEKVMGPMFPRLHVNDTEKGGPRAPPRNKMALYEQLSIPSQRFNHVVMPCEPNNRASHSLPSAIQGSGNESSVIFTQQVRARYPSERQYIQQSELSTSLPQVVEQRKKLDDDDFSVPIFVPSVPVESDKYSNYINGDEMSLSNPSYTQHSLKFPKAKEAGVFENSMKQTAFSLSHEPRNNISNSVKRLRNDESGQLELCAESRLSSDTAKRNSSCSQENLPSENQNIVHDPSNDTRSAEDGSCMPLQMEDLERGDSVSETSNLDTVFTPDITPDDVVGIIGQKLFWKARRAIVNQQRIFAVQVFELHRLLKVQKLISSSPHLMLEETSCLDKPGPVVKPLPSKKLLLGYASKATSDDPKKKAHLENPSDKNEVSAENTVEKPSLSSAQNGVSPPSLYGPPPPSTIVSDHNAPPTCFNHQQTHQWLVPVMSPTEGLVYKPYPGTGYVGHAYGGCGPPVGNFSTAMYGIPAPPPQQYPVQTFHPFGPHGYFPPYGMPMMTTSAFSGSSVEQTIPPAVPARCSAGEATSIVPQEVAVSNGQNTNTRETEVQASTASCPSEKHQNSRTSNGRRNMLTLFPTSPATDASHAGQEVPVAEQPNRVIKVVPHNSMSASESAARIFRSIQEERKQYDAVV